MGREIYLGEEWQLSSLKGKRHPYKGESVSDRIVYLDKRSAYEVKISRLERESKEKNNYVKREGSTTIHFLDGSIKTFGRYISRKECRRYGLLLRIEYGA